MNKIIVVYLGNLNSVPPVRSLLSSLSLIKTIETHLVITKDGIENNDPLNESLCVHYIDEEYRKDIPITSKVFRTDRLRKKLWKAIDLIYDDESLLWIISDVCVKNLGKQLLQYNYVLQLFELIEHAYLIPKYQLGSVHIDRFAKAAIQIIVPEYNRAHITKAWWGLDRLPFVLPNKPFYNDISTERNLEITHSKEASRVLSLISDKKIILYQGIIHKERPLENFVKAVEKLGDEYAFVVMSSGEDPYKSMGSKNYFFIPFVPAPYHLEITSRAYIGVLSYVPVKTTYSILNAVYCAPNKTFEYSRFGVPMISNDVPGLDYLFAKDNCGRIVDLDNVDSICEAISYISTHYDYFSENARKYYESVDYEKKVKELLDEVF